MPDDQLIETREGRIIYHGTEILRKNQNKREQERSTKINTFKSPLVSIETANSGKQFCSPRVLKDKMSLNVKNDYQAELELAFEPQPVVIRHSSFNYPFRK